MSEYEFVLTISGELTDERIDALCESGCDDATFGASEALIFGDFCRKADTLQDAIMSAVEDVERVDGLEVLRVEPDELVWAAEIAERTGRTRQSIDLLIKGQRGPGNFPAPAMRATRNPLWRWSEVEIWFSRYEGRELESDRSAILEAINGALQTRHGLRKSSKNADLRKALTQLVAS